MMGKITLISVAMSVVVLFGNWAEACDSVLVNGSFEDDGRIDDITLTELNGWDVNLPSGLFGGYVRSEWVTDGTFNLTVYSVAYAEFDVNDIGTLSQDLCLKDVNEIYFDLKLETYYWSAWDPNKLTAVLLIDDDVVWESNSVGDDVRDAYNDQTYIVDPSYNDANSHKLSLGLRVNVEEELTDYYKAQWDFIELNLHCGDFGYPAADFSLDCCVDFNDFAMLASHWLEDPAPAEYDLLEDGLIDERDLKAFVEQWLSGSCD